MPQTIRVKPVEGRTLPLEANPRLAVDGEMDVPTSAYYRRALKAGDIEIVQPPAPPRARAPKE